MMSFFSDPTDPKYDTVFSLLKFASAALTFSAGVIGIYSDRTLKDMKPTRLGWTLIALLFLGASSSFWTEWRQERASSAYAALETARLKHLASASDTLLFDTTKIERNAADELRAIKLTVKKVGKLSDNAEETIQRVRKTDDDTLNAVRAARSTETRSINLVAQNHQALNAITKVQGQDSTTLSGLARLDAQTSALNSGSQSILQTTRDAIKEVRRGLFPLFRTPGLQLAFWREVDPSLAGALTTRFQNLIAAYKGECPPLNDGRVVYGDSEFLFQSGQLVSVIAHKLSPAFPHEDEWGSLFKPAELDVSVWLPTSIKSASLASADLDITQVATINPSTPPPALTYFVLRNRIGVSFGPVLPKFEPANLDIVGIEDLYGSRIVTKLTPLDGSVAPGLVQLGDLSFVEGPERFAFNASNTTNATEEGYQADLPLDPRLIVKRFVPPHVPLPQVQPPCINQATHVISSATKP